MAFTTWAALKQEILDDLQGGSWKTKSYTIQGRTHTFQSLSEIRTFLKFVEEQANAEAGGATNLVSFVRPS